MLQSATRILVTGAGGFIGSHLAEYLVQRGCRVRAFLRYTSSGRRGWLEETGADAGAIEYVFGDVRDFDAVRRALDGCDVVFHLAALVGIPYSYVTPQAYIRTNVDGTYNVLEAARETGAERIVVTSTSEVYGTARFCPMNEDHPLGAQSPYAATKIAADQLALSYNRAFGLPVVVVRPFNTYGPRQSDRAVIPTLVAQVLSGTERIRLGNTSPTRDFTFVEDVARGFVAAAEAFVGEVVHVGSGTEISVSDLVALVKRITGRSAEIESSAERRRPAASEVDRLLCDNAKIRARTDWRPTVDLEEGLRRTVDWIEPRLDCFRPSEYRV